jgi:predicted MFS family arabinose efflux permease
MTGVLWSVAGALLCAAAMWTRNFWLLCLGTLVWGVHNAYGQYYRFAAADAAPAEFKATAISLVLAGGLVGGIVGPTASRLTVELLASRFMGAYLSLILVALVTLALLALLHIAPPSASEQSARGRPLAEIAAQPKFIIAVMSAAIGYGVMNFLMTSTPIAMQVCGHPYADAAFVISSHVVGMFAPSFFTGPVIKRIGALPVMFAGALANFAAIGVALSGVSVLQFWWSLVLLGVGWNFLYIGGTTLLTETYRPEERAKAQGANEQAIFLMMIASSVTSGVTVTAAGWERVNLLALPLVAAVALAIGWFAVQERARKAAAA